MLKFIRIFFLGLFVCYNSTVLAEGLIFYLTPPSYANNNVVFEGNKCIVNNNLIFENKNEYGFFISQVQHIQGKEEIDSDNNVTLFKDGTYKGDYFGGYAVTGDLNACDNVVTIQNSHIIGDIYGARATHNANKNIVNVESGIVGNVYGGNSSWDGSASNNIVNIYGGKIQTVFEDGYTVEGRICGGLGNPAHDNQINIYNYPDLSDAYIVGGLSPASWDSKNNSVNIYTKGIVAKEISWVQKLTFVLPDNCLNGEAIFSLNTQDDYSCIEEIMVVIPKNNKFNIGDCIYLLNSTNGINKLNEHIRFIVNSECNLDGEIFISQDGKHIILRIK